MIILAKTFNECSTKDLFDFYFLRSEVFVVEQNCPYQDVDLHDLKSLHVLMRQEEVLVAYCRILPPGLAYNDTAIGRVVVSKQFRNKGLAKNLMLWSLKQCFNLYPNNDIVISAQSYLSKFYQDLNFKIEGEGYLEDNIPHQKMRLRK